MQKVLILITCCYFLTACLTAEKHLSNQKQSTLTIRQRVLEQFDADRDGRLNAVERETLR